MANIDSRSASTHVRKINLSVSNIFITQLPNDFTESISYNSSGKEKKNNNLPCILKFNDVFKSASNYSSKFFLIDVCNVVCSLHIFKHDFITIYIHNLAKNTLLNIDINTPKYTIFLQPNICAISFQNKMRYYYL